MRAESPDLHVARSPDSVVICCHIIFCYYYFIVDTLQINSHYCKCVSVSQRANFNCWSDFKEQLHTTKPTTRGNITCSWVKTNMDPNQPLKLFINSEIYGTWPGKVKLRWLLLWNIFILTITSGTTLFLYWLSPYYTCVLRNRMVVDMVNRKGAVGCK